MIGPQLTFSLPAPKDPQGRRVPLGIVISDGLVRYRLSVHGTTSCALVSENPPGWMATPWEQWPPAVREKITKLAIERATDLSGLRKRKATA